MYLLIGKISRSRTYVVSFLMYKIMICMYTYIKQNTVSYNFTDNMLYVNCKYNIIYTIDAV